MRAEIIAAGEPDPARVAAACLADPPEKQALFYQKHMTHHMMPGVAARLDGRPAPTSS